MKLRTKLLREVTRAREVWNRADIGIHGAAVAYYAVFSIAPLLIIVIAVAGIMVDTTLAAQAVVNQFQGVFGDNGADVVRALISSDTRDSGNAIMAAVGTILVLLSATAVFSALQNGLDAIFANLREAPTGGIWHTVISKLLSVGMILSIGFILLASLVISTIIATLSDQFRDLVPGVLFLARVADFIASLGLIALLLGSILKFLPTKRLPWRPALFGGLIASVLFMAGKYALGVYLGSSTTLSAYGAASSVVLLILWTFYLSQAFFLSAIFTKLYLIPESAKE